MCKRNALHEKEGQNGMCQRKTTEKKKKNETSMGCVRETPQIKMKPAWDV